MCACGNGCFIMFCFRIHLVTSSAVCRHDRRRFKIKFVLICCWFCYNCLWSLLCFQLGDDGMTLEQLKTVGTGKGSTFCRFCVAKK